jgi:glycosyltransferase involved in cell wall biosynthesis
MKRAPRVAVLYHYFYPDDVVSARHLSQFCQGLRERGWEVEALPCNRGCRHPEVSYPLHEDWEGIAIRRIWRLALPQHKTSGRVLNALWMIASWCRIALRSPRTCPDVLVIGSDPILSVLVALVVRKLRPHIRIVHWCFDLYPEAAIAEGILAERSWLVRCLRGLLRQAYSSCDLIADLGACMRDRLKGYGPLHHQATLVPWALAEPDTVEPPAPTVRRELFGDARLALLYAGNFGRAHTHQEFLDLARCLRGSGVHFCFAVRGNRNEELQQAIRPEDSNVTLAGFVPEAALAPRLTAADIHLVSLRPSWAGLVVPSKFFGALAAGRPVLFAGPPDSAIGRWIEEHEVGWVIDPGTLPLLAEQLRALAADPGQLAEQQRRCQEVYQRCFSRTQVMDAWHRHLLALLPEAAGVSASLVEAT